MPAVDQAVSSRPWMAPTIRVPNRSARYAGTVAKPPPYMDNATQKNETNNARLTVAAVHGTVRYIAIPRRKTTALVILRPRRSDTEAQKILQAPLNSASRPVK